MIFRKFRPMKTPLHMMSRMISEIACEEVVPSRIDIIGSLMWIACIESTMMMIGCIDSQE